PVIIDVFFQAEDGIRDATVTGVQTCALPISGIWYRRISPAPEERRPRLRDTKPRGPHESVGAGNAQGSKFIGSRWPAGGGHRTRDRKSTRLNSSHGSISYAVFCLKKKKQRMI